MAVAHITVGSHGHTPFGPKPPPGRPSSADSDSTSNSLFADLTLMLRQRAADAEVHASATGQADSRSPLAPNKPRTLANVHSNLGFGLPIDLSVRAKDGVAAPESTAEMAPDGSEPGCAVGNEKDAHHENSEKTESLWLSVNAVPTLPQTTVELPTHSGAAPDVPSVAPLAQTALGVAQIGPDLIATLGNRPQEAPDAPGTDPSVDRIAPSGPSQMAELSKQLAATSSDGVDATVSIRGPEAGAPERADGDPVAPLTKPPWATDSVATGITDDIRLALKQPGMQSYWTSGSMSKKDERTQVGGLAEPHLALTDGRATEPQPPSPDSRPLETADAIAGAVHGRLEELRRNGRVELHLDLTPPSLGRVRVQLVTRDTAVNVRIIVHDETARQAVTGQLDALRLRLGEAGVSVGRFNVQRDGQHAGHRYEPQHDRGDSEAAVVRTRNPRGTATPGAQVLSDSTVDVIA